MSTFVEDLQELEGLDTPFLVNDEDYPDAQDPPPVVEANYRLRIKGEIDFDRNQDGSIRKSQGIYPALVLKEVEILEPADLSGTVALRFERVYSVPYARKPGGPKDASGLADLTRAHDQTMTSVTFRESLALLKKQVDLGLSFRGRIRWEAFDKDYYETLVQEEGGEAVVKNDKAIEKKLRKQSTIVGMKKFPANPDGTYQGTMKHPVSGNLITARPRLSKTYLSGADKVKIGK